jgi:uncharacterized membrane protein
MTLPSVVRGVPLNAVAVARGLFALASASLAVWILVFGQWVPQPLPAGMAFGDGLTYAGALVILAASVGLCFARTAVASVLTLGAYQVVSVAMAVPQWLAMPQSVDAWYPFFEALTPLAGAGALYVMVRCSRRESGATPAERVALRGAQALLGLTCVFYGVSHFVYGAYTATLVPGWLPAPLLVAYATGACHLAAGLALIIGVAPRLAAALEATMMSLFGLVVWIPSFFAQPPPSWATPAAQRWSELVVTFVLAAAAWVVTLSFSRAPGAHASGAGLRHRSCGAAP